MKNFIVVLLVLLICIFAQSSPAVGTELLFKSSFEVTKFDCEQMYCHTDTTIAGKIKKYLNEKNSFSYKIVNYSITPVAGFNGGQTIGFLVTIEYQPH